MEANCDDDIDTTGSDNKVYDSKGRCKISVVVKIRYVMSLAIKLRYLITLCHGFDNRYLMRCFNNAYFDDIDCKFDVCQEIEFENTSIVSMVLITL